MLNSVKILNLINQINKNKIFRFIASVRLAVPLMLVIAGVVAYGTVVESKYNSDMAKMVIYNTNWFFALMTLLWLNIFCATISRIPFKLHHTGFVIVHIGLLTLLVGGLITGTRGIDGQLRLSLGQTDTTVILPDLVVGYKFRDSLTAQTIAVDRKLNEQSFNNSSAINKDIQHLFTVNKYTPFAEVSTVYKSSPSSENKSVGVGFILRSQFFNVSEWLHSTERPMMQMGPATLKLVLDDGSNAVSEKIRSDKTNKNTKTKKSEQRNPQSQSTAKSDFLIIKDRTDTVVKKVPIDQLKKSPVKLDSGITVSYKNQYKRAVVAQNKIEEGPPSQNLNPALEISVNSQGKISREILYAKFPDFSLSTDESRPYKFQFQSANTEEPSESTASNQNLDLPSGHPQINIQQNNNSQENQLSRDSAGSTTGNLIEFHVTPGSNQVLIQLYKNQKLVGSEKLSEGQSYQTPWMGMNIILGTITNNAVSAQEIKIAEPEAKAQQLPPSALQIQFAENSENVWLTEGQSINVNLLGRPAEIFYGRKNVQLPFTLKLLNFNKVDYPGTETPMSFESTVQVNEASTPVLISMNNPLTKDGYTVYQSSYVLNPGQAPESVFSINHDPGRPIKYAGSLILCLGIIIFTVMRSKWWLKRS